jgi:tetratricopeptide (TPR) repeat protein
VGGLDLARVLEIVCRLDPPHATRYGSGFLLSGRQVLTAAHVVVGAVSVTVRDTSKASYVAPLEGMLVGDPYQLDLAILFVPDAPDLPLVEIAQVNRRAPGGIRIERCSGIGYPAFAEVKREAEARSLRETHQVDGVIRPGSGAIEDMLSLEVSSSPRELPTGTLSESPWAGMSGTAIFAGDLLVGVVCEHAERRGPSDITLTPLHRLIDPERKPSNAAEWLNRLGVSDPSRIRTLPLLAQGTQPAQRLVGVPPKPMSDLVGRAQMVERLKDALTNGRDVALYAGLPGSGKTAVANALVRDPDVRARFRLVLWTWLGTDPDLKAQLRVWAEELGVTPQECEALGSEGLAERLHRIIADQPTLIVVDDAWSTDEALLFKIGGEHTSRILTTRMETVARAFVRPAPPTFVDVLDEKEAVALVRRQAPTAMDKEPDAVLAAIGTADGLPLTILLLSALLEDKANGPPSGLRKALADVREAHFRIAQHVEGTLSPLEYRSKTFAAAMNLTLDALGDESRRALGSLALFPPRTNSFSLEAAEKVGGISEAVHDLYHMGLVNLVRDDPERYWMHQAIADYAREAQADPDAYRRMANYFIDYATRGDADGTTAEWLDGLEDEQINVSAALEWTVQAGDASTALRLASALFRFWYERSHYTTGLLWIDRILTLPGSDQPELERERAKVLNDSGNFSYSQGHLEESLRRHRGALRLRRRSGDDSVAGSWNNIALIYREQGRIRRARQLFELARDLNVAIEREPAGDPGRLALHRRWRGINLNNLGRCAEMLDDLAEATRLQQESLALFEDLGSAWGAAMARCDLATAHRRAGRLEEAQDHAEASFRVRHRTGDKDGAAASLRELAACATARTEFEDADRYLVAALGLLMEIADPGDIAVTLQALAPVRAARGDRQSAVTLAAAAARFRADNGFWDAPGVRLELEMVHQTAQRELEPARFTDAWRAGEEAELHEVCVAELTRTNASVEAIAQEFLEGASPEAAADGGVPPQVHERAEAQGG